MSKPSALRIARQAGEQARAHGPARRAREHAPGARARGLGGGRDAARRHHHGGRGQVALARRLPEAPQVTVEQRREVRVDHRGRAPLVLAELREHLVRGGDVDVRQLAAQPLRDRTLVGGVAVGEQQADRDRLGARAPGLVDDARELVLGQLLDDAVGPDPLGSAEAHPLGDQRGRLRRAEVVEAGPVLAPDVEEVGEPTGGDERGPRAALGQQRVGAHGHAVREDLDLGRLGAGALERRLDRGEDPPGLVLGRRRRLRRVQRPPVEDHRVGEGPADVDPEEHPAKLQGRGGGKRWRRGKRETPALASRGLLPITRSPPATIPTPKMRPQIQRSRRTSPSAATTRWEPSSAGSGSGKSARRCAPRDSRRSSAERAIMRASG